MAESMTTEKVIADLKGYWPASQRLTSPLVQELVNYLKARNWNYDDFSESLKKYRDKWIDSQDEKYKSIPNPGQLVSIHTPQWQLDQDKLYGSNSALQKMKLWENGKTLPREVHVAAMKNLATFNFWGYAQVFIDYYELIKNIDLKRKWERLQNGWCGEAAPF